MGIRHRAGSVPLLVLAALLVLAGCQTAITTGPRSLALVRQTASGEVVVRYVRGGTLHGVGTPVSRDIEVALPSASSADPGNAPSAFLFGDRLRVARADVQAASTTISIVSSGYASTLYESEPTTVAVLPYAIDSEVKLTGLEEDLLVAFHEGDMVRAVRSADGETWSAPFDLHAVPAGRPFALWHDGAALWLAWAGEGGIDVAMTLDGTAFTDLGATLAAPAAALRGISLAILENSIYVAWCDASRVSVARATSGVFGPPAIVAEAPASVPDYQMHSVAIHPSPSGWGLQYVAALPSGGAVEYVVFGKQSTDGLDYSGTDWTYGSSASYQGGTDMAVTPVPMPWIVKTHDSGHPADEVYNFVIAGDGFTYDERDVFLASAEVLTANFADRAPWHYHQDRFNVWVVNSFSKSSGFDLVEAVDSMDTIFGGHRTSGNMVITDLDAIRHARRMVTGSPSAPHFYGFVMHNPEEGEGVAILPWDASGVPLSHTRAGSLTAVHEFVHSGAGGFALGDHDRRGQPTKLVNKTDDPDLDPEGAHPWQHWFVFSGPAASRLIRTTDAYRAGLVAWVAGGADPYTWHSSNFAYLEDPISSSYADALSLLNVGLWESELSDVDDLDSELLFMGLRACAENSMLHHSQVFCPICSEVIVRHLSESAGETFDVDAFQSAPDAYLEFQVRNRDPFGTSAIMPPLELAGLLEVGGTAIDPSEFEKYVSVDFLPFEVARVNLAPYLTPGAALTITFRNPPAGGDPRIWLPSVQVLNGQGARYPVQPVGAALIDRLHEKHAPEADYEYWDLTEGDLVLEFVPN